MDLDSAIDSVAKSKEFKAFLKEQPKARLAHAFSMHSGKEFEWQLGYVLPNQEIVSFQTNPVKRLPADKPFNKGEPVKPLDIGQAKLKPEEAQEKAFAFLKEKHPREEATKIILILQHLDRQVFNFTLVTKAFNICNIRVDAASGEIVSSEMRSIMSLRQNDQQQNQ